MAECVRDQIDALLLECIDRSYPAFFSPEDSLKNVKGVSD